MTLTARIELGQNVGLLITFIDFLFSFFKFDLLSLRAVANCENALDDLCEISGSALRHVSCASVRRRRSRSRSAVNVRYAAVLAVLQAEKDAGRI